MPFMNNIYLLPNLVEIFFEENAKKVMKKFVDTKIMRTFVMISNVICKQL